MLSSRTLINHPSITLSSSISPTISTCSKNRSKSAASLIIVPERWGVTMSGYCSRVLYKMRKEHFEQAKMTKTSLIVLISLLLVINGWFFYLKIPFPFTHSPSFSPEIETRPSLRKYLDRLKRKQLEYEVSHWDFADPIGSIAGEPVGYCRSQGLYLVYCNTINSRCTREESILERPYSAITTMSPGFPTLGSEYCILVLISYSKNTKIQ